ncbi:MAG TPA: hypothetical protein VMT88_10015, partial [Actinomycetes bacterium]|nr:hypothetical protein [Actinomycetes bacterium]
MSLLLIAHGSPDLRHSASMQALATTVQSQSHLATSVAFLEHNDPTVVDAVRQPTADMTNQPLHVL